MNRWIGLDIGGANTKIADTDAFAKSVAFPLWKSPEGLAPIVAQLINAAPDFDRVAVTITGELADCYSTREEGICRILEQITQLIPATLLAIYSVQGEWLTPSEAARKPWAVAASNWHASASLATRYLKNDSAIVIDIGSTTIDLTPIVKSGLLTHSKIDSERMVAGELLYAGVQRTPLFAFGTSVPLHGHDCPMIPELFATTQDLFLWLGQLEDQPDSRDTADGKPATRQHAAYRLARLVGEDGDTLAKCDIQLICETLYGRFVERLAGLLERQRAAYSTESFDQVLCMGHGDFLLDAALNRLGWAPEITKLSVQLSPEMSRCAPAYAVATLASEQII
jgi:probable H4MPT-linked C1 transfer pathway protein